ncbi:MAG: TFIIH subunit Tfb4/p34, partial [Olpidium bornovanus]
DSSLLVFVLDTNPFVWDKARSKGLRDDGGDALSLEEAVKHVLVFLNAYLALTHDNRLAVVASHVGKRAAFSRLTCQVFFPKKKKTTSAFLYPFPTTTARGSRAYPGRAADAARESQRPASEYQNFKLVDDQVVARLRKLFEDVEAPLSHSDKSREAPGLAGPAMPFPASLFLTARGPTLRG